MKIKINTLLILFSFPVFCFAQQAAGKFEKTEITKQNLKFSAPKRSNGTLVYRTKDVFIGYENLNLNSLNSFLFRSNLIGFSQNITMGGINGKVFPLGKTGRGI